MLRTAASQILGISESCPAKAGFKMPVFITPKDGYDTDYVIKSVKTGGYNSIVGVILKEGLASLEPTKPSFGVTMTQTS